MADIPILLLRSSSRNFPLDLVPELAKAGIPCIALEGLDEYISTTYRLRPFVGVFEVGSLPDLERALLAFEWSELMQPLASARYVLLLASKNLPLGDRAKRFGATEIAVLPQPSRNLLFKLELQGKLLAKGVPARAAEAEGFVAQVEEDAGRRKRVLVLRGQSQKSGSWNNEGTTPQGKIRWRWVRQPKPGEAPEPDRYRWVAESSVEPEFVPAKSAWLLDDEEADLRCYKENEEIFSARQAEARRRKQDKAGQKIEPKTEKRAEPGNPPEAADRGERHGTGPAEPQAEAKEPRPGPAKEEPAEPAARGEKPAPLAEATKKTGSAARGEKPAQAGAEAGAKVPAAVNARKRKEDSVREEGEAPAATKAPLSLDELAEARSRQQRERAAAASPEDPPQAGARVEGAEEAEALSEGPAAQAVDALDGIPSVRAEEEKAREHGRSEAFQSLQDAELDLGLGSKVAQWNDKIGQRELPAPAQAERGETAAPSLEAAGGSARPQALEAELLERKRERPETQAELESLERKKREAQGGEPGALRELPGRASREVDALERAAPAGARPVESLPEEAKGVAPAGGAGEGLAAKAETVGGERHSLARADSVEVRLPSQPERERERLTVPELRLDSGGERSVVSGAGSSQEGEMRLRAGARAGAESADAGEHYLRSRHFVTMTLAELNDKESSWHPIQRYRIYLSAQQRYFGLKHPREVLPLWIYEGELAPEFLDTQAAWKFYDRPPVMLSTLEALPIEVTEYLHKLAGLPLPENLLPRESGRADPPDSIKAPGSGIPLAGDGRANAPKPKRRFWGAMIDWIRKRIGR